MRKAQSIYLISETMRKTAATKMIDVPDDLITEILSYLPPQSLISFKTVCKSWNNIISSPSFSKLHLKNYPANNFALLAFDETTRKWKFSMKTFSMSSPSELIAHEYFLELPTMMKSQRFKDEIAGPFNDFICIYGIAVYGRIGLCNPNLCKTEILPTCPIPDDDRCFRGYTMRTMGMGLDSVTKEIKIVQLLSCLTFDNDGKIAKGIRVDIYIPSTKTWRQVFDYDDAATSGIFVAKTVGSYKDGSFAHFVDDVTPSFVLSFDMQKEVFVRTPIPFQNDKFTHKMKIFAKDSSSLVLFAYPREQVSDENYLFDRWELNGLGERGHWTRLMRVGPLLGVSEPVGVLWSSRLLVVRTGNKLLFCDYSTCRVRRVYYAEGHCQFNCHDFVKVRKVFEYKGSLFY